MKDIVRERYAHHARTLPDEADGSPPSLGVGDPVTLARLRTGETVLDLGSGPGRDLFAAAHAVGPTGRAIGVDMTAEMLARSRAVAADTGLRNVTILDGDIERLPLPCGSVDVVISNCVINLADDKVRALSEAYRVLVPGGRLAIVDTAWDAEPGDAARADADSWACCVGGALTVARYGEILREIGFVDVAVERTDAACAEDCSTVGSVAVTATKPGSRSDGVVLRTAVPADGGGIADVLHGCGLIARDLAIEDAIVAVDGDRVSGVVAVERHGTAALLHSLAVAPRARRAGLGTRLAVAALEVARWSGAEEVYLLTETAQGFFERLRFEPVSRRRAQAALPSGRISSECCSAASAMRLSFEEADLPLLGRPSRKQLATFQDGSCC